MVISHPACALLAWPPIRPEASLLRGPLTRANKDADGAVPGASPRRDGRGARKVKPLSFREGKYCAGKVAHGHISKGQRSNGNVRRVLQSPEDFKCLEDG